MRGTMEASICPKGHGSTEADYCSECGAKLEGAALASESSVTPAAPSSGETCPECGVAREPRDVVFCEICGYNFVTGARGEFPVAVLPAAAKEQDTPPAVGTAWEVVVAIDEALREPGSPEIPAGVGPFIFQLETPASLIGRRSEARAIFPEIAVYWDNAVSHRHALLQRDSAGLVLRDIGSANGTRLNGAEIPPMTDQRLADGDRIALGHWTSITVRAIQ